MVLSTEEEEASTESHKLIKEDEHHDCFFLLNNGRSNHKVKEAAQVCTLMSRDGQSIPKATRTIHFGCCCSVYGANQYPLLLDPGPFGLRCCWAYLWASLPLL